MCTAHARTRIEPNECANTNVRVYYYYYYYYYRHYRHRHRHRHRRYTTTMIILYGRRSRRVRGGDGELSPRRRVSRAGPARETTPGPQYAKHVRPGRRWRTTRKFPRHVRLRACNICDENLYYTHVEISYYHLLYIIIIIAPICDITDIR